MFFNLIPFVWLLVSLFGVNPAEFSGLFMYTNVDYGMMNAMSFIYIIPSLLFFFTRKYLIRSVMAGS